MLQIDIETILGIGDTTLATYVDLLGDRVALRNFCTSTVTESKASKKKSKRAQLFETLRRKLSTGGEDGPEDHESSTSSKRTTASRRKATRRVEFGWIHQEKQVRKRQGGGTRKVDVDRTATKEKLLEIGKELFFPQGESTKGPSTDFSFDILDFKETSLPDKISVSECYELFKIGIVTFYLHSQVSQRSEGSSLAHIATIVDEAVNEELGSGLQETLPNLVEYGDDVSPVMAVAADPDTDFLTAALMTADELSNDTMDLIEIANACHDSQPPMLKIRLHRGHVFQELNDAIENGTLDNSSNIQVEMVMPNGTLELGDDSGGVLRDAFS